MFILLSYNDTRGVDMRKISFLAVITFFIMLSPAFLSATANEAGAVFLTIFPGAGPVGMGNSFTAISDNALANYYNIGGAGFIENNDIILMHSNWLPGLAPDMYYEYLGIVHPVKKWNGVIGGEITYITPGMINAQDATGSINIEYRVFDAEGKISYATKFNDKLSIGIGLKFIYLFLAPDWVIRTILPENSGSGEGIAIAGDFGLLYKPIKNYLNIGVSLQNIGPNINYLQSSSSDPLPRLIRLGFASNPVHDSLNDFVATMDLIKVLVFGSDSTGQTFWEIAKEELEDTWMGIGVQYTYYNFITGRFGYFLDYSGDRHGFTYGGGIRVKQFKIDIGVDSDIYGFNTSNYRISLSYQF
ncbi:MAG TPA: PorV/PorQ family protein [Bacteroidetes bacterium]|nr:PorV/PorQ family protein [Bacteroidota bacterium]